MENVPLIRKMQKHQFTFEEHCSVKYAKVFHLYLYELIILMTSPVSHFGSLIKEEFSRIESYLQEEFEKNGSDDSVGFEEQQRGLENDSRLRKLKRDNYEAVESTYHLPKRFMFRDVYNILNGSLSLFTDCIPYGAWWEYPQSRMKMIPVQIANIEIPARMAEALKQEACRLLGFKVSK